MPTFSSEARWLGPFAGIVLLFFGLAFAKGTMLGIDAVPVIARSASKILFLAPFLIIISLAVFTIRCAIRGERQPIAATARVIRDRFQASPAVAVSALVAVLLIPFLMGAFGLMKMTMTQTVPFYMDDSLARLDRILFFGIDPWRITYALFGAGLPSLIIDAFYTLWVPTVMIGVLLAACANRQLRAQYFLSFALAWLLLGTFAAYLLSSAGPCYAALVGTDTAEWFKPLMQRLEQQHATWGSGAYHWQGVLWADHKDFGLKFGGGISAAPSMHNALCMLYVLATARSGWPLRTSMKAFAVIIWIGSVHTGWHYAVDGLLAWAGMIVIWKAVGAYLVWVRYADVEHASVSRPALA